MSSSTPNRTVTLSIAVLAVFLLLAAGQCSIAQECGGGSTMMCDGGGTACGSGGAICDSSGSSGYAWPNYCGMAAPQYPVPYEVPQWVGRTEFTYPPVMPHHSLPHYRKTYAYRHGPGMARTTVKWRPSLCDTLKRVCKVFELPR